MEPPTDPEVLPFTPPQPVATPTSVEEYVQALRHQGVPEDTITTTVNHGAAHQAKQRLHDLWVQQVPPEDQEVDVPF